MRPAENTKVWRKGQRDSRKGVPTGRRISHQTRVTARELKALGMLMEVAR